jgi:hypothetical protein
VPLKKGKSQKVVSQNIREFHKGPTYQRTLRKFGKQRADDQAVAAALEEQRRSSGKPHNLVRQKKRR